MLFAETGSDTNQFIVYAAMSRIVVKMLHPPAVSVKPTSTAHLNGGADRQAQFGVPYVLDCDGRMLAYLSLYTIRAGAVSCSHVILFLPCGATEDSRTGAGISGETGSAPGGAAGGLCRTG